MATLEQDWFEPEFKARLAAIAKDVGSLNDYEGQLSNKVHFLLDAGLGFISIEQNDLFRGAHGRIRRRHTSDAGRRNLRHELQIYARIGMELGLSLCPGRDCVERRAAACLVQVARMALKR